MPRLHADLESNRRGDRLATALRVALSASPLLLALAPLPAAADCVTVGLTTTCNTSAPNPFPTRVGDGPVPADDGRTVIITNGASILTGNVAAISLRDGGTITVQSGGSAQSVGVTDVGPYNAGPNTIEFRNNTTLTIEQGAQVLATGTILQGEAINPQGTGNIIINSGLIRADNAAALWFETFVGRNTVINNATGVIQATAVPSVIGFGDGLGTVGMSTLDFTNRGAVIGNLIFGSGDDILRLYAGQTISGNLSGGLGNDTIYLSGTAPGSFTGLAPDFETLIKNDAGTWTITGPITGPTSVTIQAGTLILTGDNSAYAGTLTVDAAGTLQGRAQVLPAVITDNGLVRFAQPDAGTYAGLITGTGSVEKTGAGVLTLAPSAVGGNTYTGSTILTGGVLAIAADNAIGAPTAAVVFNGGTLRYNAAFDLAATRPVSITAAGGTIDTNGLATTITQGVTGAGGLAVTGGGRLVLTGASTYAGGTSIAAGTRLQLGNGGSSGAILGNVANAGTLAFNRADTLTFAGVVSGTGGVEQAGPGTTVLTGASTYSGATAVNAGTLRAGATNAFSPASAYAVAAGATLDTAGLNQTVAGLTNAGLVTLRGAAPGATLTVAGNYVGQGGVVALNTVLAGDGAPSDRFVIRGGTATGDTRLRIVNAGGSGAQTRADGIRVVETNQGGTTAAGAFRLDTRVTAGAYEYRLFRGGSTSTDDYFLRSFLDDGPGRPGSTVPLYRPEAALYAPIPAIGRQMGLVGLGTLHERVGEEENIRDLEGSRPYANGGWARAIGERSETRWDGTVDARVTGDLVGLQAGFDILRYQAPSGHRDHVGVYAAYLDYNGSANGFALGQQGLRVGRLTLSGPAAGAYWTHFGPSGWYLDAVVQAHWFDVTARSDYSSRLTTNGSGLTASLEGGYPIRFGANWQVEPQAQLIWQSVSIDRSRDAFSSVSWDEGDAVTGRLGARVQYTGRDETTLWQPYAKVNLWHAFSGTDRATLGNSAPIENRYGDTALEVGAGVTARISRTTSFYAHADYRWSLDGERTRQTAVQGAVGIRVNF
ncbi:autotransporter family protein [Plastoroseomonas arctica]|uniref:Autotransporter outer membrane beta-barrel domain-containing protein n=1 Tax=Plastoroseomonas arctica TaxID=1509237 RepID=A0AAF1K5M5_9PROT|nr:autotransporter outer membrane beta-barrel domain-containing protein [Plastoroseomonas arctica]MBR0656481.1 autotransporter outer membrane beta-barrel domain-containing protein [Plastoroseomonas arctica]